MCVPFAYTYHHLISPPHTFPYPHLIRLSTKTLLCSLGCISFPFLILIMSILHLNTPSLYLALLCLFLSFFLPYTHHVHVKLNTLILYFLDLYFPPYPLIPSHLMPHPYMTLLIFLPTLYQSIPHYAKNLNLTLSRHTSLLIPHPPPTSYPSHLIPHTSPSQHTSRFSFNVSNMFTATGLVF